MIVIFSPNLAVDRTLEVPGFKKKSVSRATDVFALAGGKGVNVAKALKALGQNPHIVGLVAGPSGQIIRNDLDAQSLPATLIEGQGDSRTCTLILDPLDRSTTVVNEEGLLELDPPSRQRLIDVLDHLLARADALVLSGSLPKALPPSIYATLIQRAKEKGVFTALDSSGEALAFGVAQGPNLIKPNAHELSQLIADSTTNDSTRIEPQDPDTAWASPKRLAAACQKLHQKGVELVVVSLGAFGAFASESGGAWFANAPSVEPVNTTGAGDSTVAGLVTSLLKGAPLPEALTWGIACGTADVLTKAAGHIRPVDIKRLQKSIHVEKVKH